MIPIGSYAAVLLVRISNPAAIQHSHIATREAAPRIVLQSQMRWAGAMAKYDWKPGC